MERRNEKARMKNEESIPGRSLEEIVVAFERQKIEGNDILLSGTLKTIPDALFYLKQLLEKGKPITGKKYHITIDGQCPRCNFMVNSKMNFCPTCGEKLPNDYKELVHFDECNCPLTIEDLEKMIGKPVFIIHNWKYTDREEKHSMWAVVKGFMEFSSGRTHIEFTDRLFAIDDYGKNWMAYRNEVQDDD